MNDLTKNDIRFTSGGELDWTSGHAGTAIKTVETRALAHAATAVEWYLGRKGSKRLLARATRLCAIILVIISGLVPLIGEIFQSNSGPGINPLWASVALVLAGGMIGIDRFFGFSSGYMRYLTTEMKLQRIMQDFSLDSETLAATLAGAEPTPPQIREAVQRCRRLLTETNEIVQAETRSWVQEFNTALSEIDKSARAQTEFAQVGSINLTLKNSDQCPDGWQVSVDGGSLTHRKGKTATIGGVAAGTHSVRAEGAIGGDRKTAEGSISVLAGATADLELTLV